MLTRIFLAFFLALAPLPTAFALESASPTVSQGVVSFSSDEGLARLSRSDARSQFSGARQSVRGRICRRVLWSGVSGHRVERRPGPQRRSAARPKSVSARRSSISPPGADPTTPRFTQDNVIAKGPKTRAQIFGEPVTINGRQLHDFGFQLRQLDDMLKANGLATRLVVVDDGKDEQEIRTDLVNNLKRRGDYVIVNYLRKAAGQPGPPHISPLGAYDAQSELLPRSRRKPCEGRLGMDAGLDPRQSYAHLRHGREPRICLD